ncbi:MAG: calcium-binding protein, partial [Gomphosphaeria aponina SAG 52.96 = DSM 107014]|nr:calcium-binding protein [Gomphosphaeria aponina SAG 52.96 = DSM 107014]
RQADNIPGKEGNDIILGWEGNDTLLGESGNDSLLGENGNDSLDGGAGKDTMAGGSGNDIYAVSETADVVIEAANAGTDVVNTSADTYTLSKEVENLILTGTGNINGTGNQLNNNITGNSGNNAIDGAGGSDTMAGGAGDDTYTVTEETDIVIENVDAGTDTVKTPITHALVENVENIILTGTNNVNATGNALNNQLTGNSGNNNLDGAGGNNILDGAGGNDSMAGGTGNDTYIVTETGDKVTEAVNAGTDVVISTVNHTLANNTETLNLQGTANINGTGNSGNNNITGNSGNNIIDGGAGKDTMGGGTGNDIYTVSETADVIIEAANAGTDTVNTPITLTLTANVEKIVLTGKGNINATGNTLANNLTGNSGNNTLDGGGGNDSMAGGAGNDIYTVSQKGDEVIEAANAGTDVVNASVNHELDANVEKMNLTGTGDIDGNGNSGDNIITGNSGSNTINSKAGNDILDGGTGEDILIGGTGNDIYVVSEKEDVVIEKTNAGTDTVNSFIAYSLGNNLNLENLILIGTANINGTGNTLDNLITGNSGNNTLNGGNGNDILTGGNGNDILVGGAGADKFMFNAPSERIDTIQGFLPGTDKICINKVGFNNLETIQLVYNSDTIPNTLPTFIYNTTGTNGLLSFDPDGSGVGGATQFATLTGKPALTASDMTIF